MALALIRALNLKFGDEPLRLIIGSQLVEVESASQAHELICTNRQLFENLSIDIFQNQDFDFATVLKLTIDIFFQDPEKFRNIKYLSKKFMIYQPQRFKDFDLDFMEYFNQTEIYYLLVLSRQSEAKALLDLKRYRRILEVSQERNRQEIYQKITALAEYL